jgi:serine kinase of HPr protein (carbohydrate metabolism regulator)
MLVHGTCVAIGMRGALLLGPSGAGKSDLALRFLFLPPDALGDRPKLVADDQVELEAREGKLLARCPTLLRGKLEVRGLGIIPIASQDVAEVVLIAKLEPGCFYERMPRPDETESLLGVATPCRKIDPFEASAPMKLACAIVNFPMGTVD